MLRYVRSYQFCRLHWLAVCALAAVMGLCGPVQAASASVVGMWRTIDDSTHKPKSLVETFLRDNKLYGRVVKVLNSEHGPHPRCEKCSGDQKDAPVEGLQIMADLVEDKGSWEQGSVLDPANGKIYRCRVRLASPDRLEVRGYIGTPLFGRTQVWERAPAQDTPPAAP